MPLWAEVRQLPADLHLPDPYHAAPRPPAKPQQALQSAAHQDRHIGSRQTHRHNVQLATVHHTIEVHQAALHTTEDRAITVAAATTEAHPEAVTEAAEVRLEAAMAEVEATAEAVPAVADRI